jgi:hypothetical protein
MTAIYSTTSTVLTTLDWLGGNACVLVVGRTKRKRFSIRVILCEHVIQSKFVFDITIVSSFKCSNRDAPFLLSHETIAFTFEAHARTSHLGSLGGDTSTYSTSTSTTLQSVSTRYSEYHGNFKSPFTCEICSPWYSA